MDTITIPTAADMHIHLRQGALMNMVTPAVAQGGVSICYVMVNGATLLHGKKGKGHHTSEEETSTSGIKSGAGWTMCGMLYSHFLSHIFFSYHFFSPTSNLRSPTPRWLWLTRQSWSTWHPMSPSTCPCTSTLT